MNSDLAPGKDGIPAELYKAAGPEEIDVFCDILRCIWEQEKMPANFQDALIVALYKIKTAKLTTEIIRGMLLLSIVWKILAQVLLNLLITMSEANQQEVQYGFHSEHNMVEMIFSLRQDQEKCIEQNLDLYSIFIDLTKAFDTVNREAFWSVLT